MLEKNIPDSETSADFSKDADDGGKSVGISPIQKEQPEERKLSRRAFLGLSPAAAVLAGGIGKKLQPDSSTASSLNTAFLDSQEVREAKKLPAYVTVALELLSDEDGAIGAEDIVFLESKEEFLKLFDLRLKVDPDFEKKMTRDGFCFSESRIIYLNGWRSTYQKCEYWFAEEGRHSDWVAKMAGIIAHEAEHALRGGNESSALFHQLNTLEALRGKGYFWSEAGYRFIEYVRREAYFWRKKEERK